MTKYKPERDIPEFARALKTLSPTKLVEEILKKRNIERKPQSITMWFKDHADIEEQLRKEIVEGLPTAQQAVDQSVFQNGTFDQTESIKNWVLEMNARELDKDTMRVAVNTIRLICQGRFPHHNLDFVASGQWCLKHPDRLTLQDAMEIITLLREKDVDTCGYKKALKDFLTSKGIVVGKKIVVGSPKSKGKYAKLKASEDQLSHIVREVGSKNREAGLADEFMLKTATRLSASLNARIENIIEIPASETEKEHGLITVFDKGRRSKYAEGKPWDKKLDADLLAHIKALIGQRKNGLIFEELTEETLSKLNHEAIRQYCPEVVERYPDFMPNHFFRHCFAQIMLERTNWNYAIVGSLGGWTAKALEESYGKPPDELVKEWSKKYSLEIKL